MRKLILASSSPRRRQLLEREGYKFQTLTVEISEIFEENLNLEEALKEVTRKKAEAVIKSGKLLNLKDFLILSGDTIVVLEGEILGKPKNSAQAVEYLTRLSGKTHSVMTGICLWDGLSGEVVLDIGRSQVTFNELSKEQIQAYVDSGDPMDKAGAYGIQTVEKGFIKSIDGSIENVMGLPIELVQHWLVKKKWDVDKK
ncbi:MAG: septum formation protein Maf [Bdellovibrionales bacterium]|nr:septum formation protein Maf [Bdellovibrionales bacterium]